MSNERDQQGQLQERYAVTLRHLLYFYIRIYHPTGAGVPRRRSAVWKIYAIVCGIYMVLNGTHLPVSTTS